MLMPHMANLPWMTIITLSIIVSFYMNNNLNVFIKKNTLKAKLKQNFWNKW